MNKLFFLYSFLCSIFKKKSMMNHHQYTIKSATWSLLFKPILQSLSQLDNEYQLVADVVNHIKQKIIDLYYYRRFFTKTKQDLHTIDTRNLTIERLNRMLFQCCDENTQRYGFHLKMVYTQFQLSPKTRLLDLVTEEDLEALIAKTTKDDCLWILQTRYLHSPLSSIELNK